MDFQINEKLIKYNFSSRNGERILYIVIHDTDNRDKGADANAHYTYFNGGDRQASAHYFVDDTQILRTVKDENKSWAIGDGGGKYGITNENSISIEMCVNSDGDFNKTYINTLKLTKSLIDKYNIELKNVVRHYDASHKICPYSMSSDNWKKWNEFKEDLKKDIKEKDYRGIINKVYNNLFGRDGDSEGIEYWNTKLNQGYSYGEMLKEFGDGEEFYNKYVG